jgi:tryptophan 2,3-dioxygenase
VLTYRDEAQWHLHAEIVESALEVEAALLSWRQQHVRLVEKMVGSKRGTAASPPWQSATGEPTNSRP